MLGRFIPSRPPRGHRSRGHSEAHRHLKPHTPYAVSEMTARAHLLPLVRVRRDCSVCHVTFGSYSTPTQQGAARSPQLHTSLPIACKHAGYILKFCHGRGDSGSQLIELHTLQR